MSYQKVLKFSAIIIATVFWLTGKARAQDITAIDFTGAMIGKVIPDGTAINLQNEIMGQLTADGWILDSKGEIVGGIVPQGFAIGNDQKYLGKVSGDGSVRLPSGKIAGKALPNGLVINDLYEVVGAVLSSGIIYNDEGTAVGRLAGNGAYVNFDGQTVGFVSPSGYAYRKTEGDPVLEGKLISAKMVVSMDGRFIGSLSAGGHVTDFEGTFIGKVHANGFVYDQDGHVIGKIVQSGYAFDNLGQYLGAVSYNGEVLQAGHVVGRYRADGKIADLQGNIIGFSIDADAVALSENGTFLGYLTPSGKIMRGEKQVATVAPRGLVVSDDKVAGYIASKGPVFDYLGALKAEAMPNGNVVSFSGATIGFMQNKRAFDRTGTEMGGILKDAVVLSSKQQVLGPVGVGSGLTLGTENYQISPFGYVYNSDMNVVGNLLQFGGVYDEEGIFVGQLDANGKIEAKGNLVIASGGYALNEKSQIIGRQINPSYVVPYDSKTSLYMSDTNVLYDEKKSINSKILPEYQIIKGDKNAALMPIIGFAGYKNGLAVNLKGETVGYVDPKAGVLSEGKKVGRLISEKTVVDLKNNYLGAVVSFSPVLGADCSIIGVLSGKGEVRSGRDNALGHVLANGQAVSEVGKYIGYAAPLGPVYDFQNHLIGMSSETGEVWDNAQRKGCLTWSGRLYDENSALKGRVYENALVMSFENKLIGRTDIKGRFIDNSGHVSGFVTPDGTVVNQESQPLGLMFKYQFAFDLQNNFVGYVLPDGNAYNEKNELFGTVEHDGSIVSKKKLVGYALYDLYVYNNQNEVIGYLTNKGIVKNFSGDNIGQADRGFLVSTDNRLIGRGNRDYFVRDNANRVIGEILLSGRVKGHNGNEIGTVSEGGDVRDSKGRLLTVAKPLQFYDLSAPRAASWAKTPQTGITVSPIKVEHENEEDMPVGEYNQKVIGVVLSPDGQYIGDYLDNGFIVDPKTGEIIGYGENGLAYDQEGEVIGSIDKQKETTSEPAKTSSSIFLPQDAYGINNTPTNLGPGGGYGPNERYDPVRSRALSMAQSERLQNIRMGVVTSEINPSSYTGYQDNWDNANFIMSSWRVDMSEMILADKPIPAVLARTIMTGSLGDVPITAIVERNVYAEDGRNIVIPAGSRVIGKSSGGGSSGGNGNATTGATRIDITWERLIRPDGSAFEFKSAQTGDAQGRGGALGYLDPQLMKRYGFPISLAFMQGAINVAMAQGNTTTNDNGTTTQDARAAAFQDARNNVNQTIQQIIQQIIDDKMESVQAVSYVPAGTRLIIYPKTDMWIRTAEREKSQDKINLDKPTVLLNDSDPYGSTRGNPDTNNNSGGGSSTVLYDGNSNAQPTSSSSLLDEQPAQQKRRVAAPVYTPPPTTSSSGNSGGSNTTPAASSSTNESSTGTGQLF